MRRGQTRFSPQCSTRSSNDVRQYEARRKAGGIWYGGDAPTPPIRQRSVQADIKLLKQMLSWACTRTMPGGGLLVGPQSAHYVRVKAEHDVRRPVASFDRFEATRAAMRQFQQRYTEDAEVARRDEKDGETRKTEARCHSWIRAELALNLLEQTGRRRGAIMGLRWTDFDSATRHVTWRAEHDKKRKTWVVPYPDSFFQMGRGFQRRLGAVGGHVFPRGDGSERPAPPDLLSQSVQKAERAAGLGKLTGGTCHPYRRKWRSERSHLPTKAVATAGGWTDVATMERCYDIPDDEDVLAVTSEPKKRRELVSKAG